ncbi:hypothetical protein CR513_47485, partial [Mucuna pruriens]
MLDLGASINVMPTSIYKALNFGDLELTRMTIQLANTSIVQPLGVLEDVLVQVNELIFPTDFYMLDMEDETYGQGSTLIMGRQFLMTARTKIDVHVGILSMEFGDTLVQFNIFKAMKHPTEDHSIFDINLIDELVEEYFQLDSHRSSREEEVDYTESGEVHNLSDFANNNNDIVDLDFEVELLELFSTQLATIFTAEYESAKGSRDRERIEVISAKTTTVKVDLHIQMHVETISAKEDQKQARALFILDNKVPFGSDFKAKQRAESDSNPTRTNSIKRSRPQQPKAEIMSAHLVPSPTQVDQPDPKASHDNSSSPPPPMELKSLPKHLKYAYLDTQQQLPVIIAKNLHQEQEDKLLQVLRQHKKAIGRKLSDLPGINPSICMHRILLKEAAKPIRQQQRRMNLTILDVVKKKVTKLLAARIIYPISDNQWVSPVQVVSKKFEMTA